MKSERLIGQVNTALFNQLKKQGKEVKEFKKRGKIIGAIIIDPFKRLLEKDKINSEQFWAAKRYSSDFELANLSNHARPIYDGTPISSASTKYKERNLSDRQINADKRIEEIKMLIKYKLTNHRQRRIREKLAERKNSNPKTSYQLVLFWVFEKQVSIRKAEVETGFNHEIIEKNVSQICNVMLDYYQK